MSVKQLYDALLYLIEKGYEDLVVFAHHRPTKEDVEIQCVVPHLNTPTAYVTLEEGNEKCGVPEFQVMDRQALEVMQNRHLVPQYAALACCANGHDFFHVKEENLLGVVEHLIICRRCGEARKVQLQP